jgi:hypothetical protein
MSESLWSFMRREHPILARAIWNSHKAGIDTVASTSLGPSRRYVWECIRKNLPETAALLTDPVFVEIKGFFGATIEIESRVICRAIAMERRNVSRVTKAA